jgi:hypothetical protein
MEQQPETENIPLHTLSIVLTWVPSSMVCSVKSISGTGRLLVTARTAVSTYLSCSMGWSDMIAVCMVVAKRSKSESVEVERAAMPVAWLRGKRAATQWQQRRLDPATLWRCF